MEGTGRGLFAGFDRTGQEVEGEDLHSELGFAADWEVLGDRRLVVLEGLKLRESFWSTAFGEV